MKKVLCFLIVLPFVLPCEVMAFSPTYTNPTESTINFYPMMRRQMEEQVTLDFENNPEEYKSKRAKKEAAAEYRAGNKNFNPNYGADTGFSKFKIIDRKKEFSTDSNGNIIIKDAQ